jgi:tRNA pseudouridine38-40 synthase
MILEPEGIVERINSHLPEDIRVLSMISIYFISERLIIPTEMYRTLNGFHCKNAADFRVYEYILPTYAFATIIGGPTSNFKFGAEDLKRVNNILRYYEGTQNFWNFTVGQKYEEPSSTRFMRSVTVSNRGFWIDHPSNPITFLFFQNSVENLL